MNVLPLLPLLGMGIGLLMAMTGTGGGMLAVPIIMFVLGLRLTEAVPVALLAAGLAAAFGTGFNLREGTVRYRAALVIASLGILTAPFGLWLARRLPEQPLALSFAAVLMLVAAFGFRQALRERHHGPPPRGTNVPCVIEADGGRLRWTLPCIQTLTATGALAGLLAGLLGIGGGFVLIPALTRYTNLAMHSIVATALAVSAPVTLSGALSAAFSGAMSWQLASGFAAGTIAGLLLGRPWAKRLEGPRLRQMFAIATAVAGVLLALRALDLAP